MAKPEGIGNRPFGRRYKDTHAERRQFSRRYGDTMPERRQAEGAEPAGPEPRPVGTAAEPGRSEVFYFPSRGITPAVELPVVGAGISWGAILAGTVVALVTHLLLSLLGLSIGLGVIGPGDGGLAEIGIGAAIWWSVSALIALFAGGWVAGRLAGIAGSMPGVLHGIVTWGFVTVLSIYLMTTAVGGLIGGGLGLVGQGLETADRGAIGIPPVERIQEGAREAMEEAARVAPRLADSAAWGAFAAFAALLLGGVAAAIGGRAGAPRSEPPVAPPPARRQ
jgi:hypothetical protein